MTEEAWIERARRGDRDAFAALIDAHLPSVRRFLGRLGTSDDDLDDLTQEVFLTMLSSLGQFRAESKISTWLLGIAARAARRQRSRDARHPSHPIGGFEAVESLAAAGGDDATEVRDELARLRVGLERLSAPLREAFVLRHVEERSVAEAASILDVPEGTVRRRAHDARERLRRFLVDAVDAEARR